MNRVLVIAKRGMATTASGLVRPPINVFGLDGRYATALYSAASKKGKLADVEKDLSTINSTLKTDSKFRDFLQNPLIPINEKKTILQKALSEKIKVSELTLSLLGVMAENNRLKLLPHVARTFKKIMAASRGEIECTVITAKPVNDAAMKSEIEAALKGFSNAKLTINMEVDPSIIGGMVVDFNGEHFIDMSIRSRLKMYSDLVKQPV